jgi:BirA family biotin operon repressor/biotin-[acetyl-CoA-carboxylase] ligase
MNHSNLVFTNIGPIDSTNNYAIAQINEGLAKGGMAWFSNHQTAGKGQRGKVWESNPNENIALTMVFEPPQVFESQPFLFNALISLAVRSFLEKTIQFSQNSILSKLNNQLEDLNHPDSNEKVYIKWPNDLWIRDRKAGGILIENKYRGQLWQWTVVGVGINVNQTYFSENLKNAVSLKQITHEEYNSEQLAIQLHQVVSNFIYQIARNNTEQILSEYNQFLYKKGEKVRLKKESAVFETTIKSVDKQGSLITLDNIERSFQFGEVEWIF